MNILHMKYAVEIANSASINKAAQKLMVAQPNLSRSLKDLEADLGITIFERSPSGMTLTSEGEEFIGYAQKIITQIHDVEELYMHGRPKRKIFTASVPRSSYITDAFAETTLHFGDTPMDVYFSETNNMTAMRNILERNYNLGILRFASDYDLQFQRMFREKNLTCQRIMDFQYQLICSKSSTLVDQDEVRMDDLQNYVEVAHSDPYIPNMPSSMVRQSRAHNYVAQRISVFERGSQFDILNRNCRTYMWVSPIPQHLLDRYDLVQLQCKENNKVYRDMLIYRDGHRFTELEEIFLEELKKSASQCRVELF